LTGESLKGDSFVLIFACGGLTIPPGYSLSECSPSAVDAVDVFVFEGRCPRLVYEVAPLALYLFSFFLPSVAIPSSAKGAISFAAWGKRPSRLLKNSPYWRH
jgi:hypothetical protein